MSFRDDKQRAEVCETLVSWMGKGVMWSNSKATELAMDLFAEDKLPPWSPNELKIWRLAWAVWSPDNEGPTFSELYVGLDPRRMRMVGRLLLAMADGTTGVDRWLQQESSTN